MSTYKIGETHIYVANPIKPFIAAVKWIVQKIKDIPITIRLLVNWIKGLRYYAIDSSFFDVFPPQTLKAGAIVKVENRNYPHDPKIRPNHKAVGETFVILEIDHIAYSKKWGVMRLGKCNPYNVSTNNHTRRPQMSEKIDPKDRGTFVEEFLEGFDRSELARKVGDSIVETLKEKHAGENLTKSMVDGLFSEHPDVPDALRDDLKFRNEVDAYILKKVFNGVILSG